ncbi:MAG: type III pantothenate kinase [Sideroxydans sp.]|nr:type III pantothenate kinase [Sideroxydans sp.]
MLLVDIGNSRVKWTQVSAGVWTHSESLDNCHIDTLANEFAKLASPSRVLVSNVAGQEMAEKVLAACVQWRCPIDFVVAKERQCGVVNSYLVPSQLGSDRWAALIAAWHVKQGACVVVNCGTATTIDALSAEGVFMGGLILPGVSMMCRSLAKGTAQLDLEPGRLQDFPCNTADAIWSGVIRATLGAVEKQIALLSVTTKQVHCLVSGGAADQVLPYLEWNATFEDNLVLRGLEVIGDEPK